jgi:nucleoside-diphosphate-sugar epimerase
VIEKHISLHRTKELALSMELADQFSGQKVFITGASGFLGRHLCRRLYTSGAEVHAIARRIPDDCDTDLHWWKGDVGDLNTVQSLIEAIRADVIFHLTSHGIGAPDLKFVLPTLYSDLLATVNVLTVAAQQGCSRMIVTASLEEPQPDSSEITPPSPYAAAKWASSAYARMFHRLYHTPVVIVRPFMTYGPGQRVHKIIPYVTLELLQGRTPKLSSGRREIDWIYVDDVIDGLLAAAQKRDVEGDTIDLGSGTLVPVQEVVMRLTALVDSRLEPYFGAFADRPFEQVRVADTDYAYAKLGWRSVTPLAQGLARTVDWYREQLSRLSLGNVLSL